MEKKDANRVSGAPEAAAPAAGALCSVAQHGCIRAWRMEGDHSDTATIHVPCFEKTGDTMQYALHLSTCVTSFCVELAVSRLLYTLVATIHECNVEDTFSFENPVQPHRKPHLEKNTYRSYLNGDKTDLNSTLFRINLHAVYS